MSDDGLVRSLVPQAVLSDVSSNEASTWWQGELGKPLGGQVTVDDLIRELSDLSPLDRQLQLPHSFEGVWVVNTNGSGRQVSFRRPSLTRPGNGR